MYANRSAIAQAIAARLENDRAVLIEQWKAATPVQHFVIDDLLDPDWVREVAAGYPNPKTMMRRSSLRERKLVSVAVDAYPEQVRDALYAFHAPEVIAAVRAITGLSAAVADPSLYASGLSVMGQGDFLNPHIDNSHDGDGKNYRVLNLLYYVSEDWHLENGGHLELWDPRITQPKLVQSRFNRLVVMATHPTSWHSVSRVRADGARRCVSNYYFSPEPLIDRPYRNVTTFTGRPEQPVRRAVLGVVDGIVLNAIGRALPRLLRLSRHRRSTSREPAA